jgi:molybdopterin-guanine dinucleotide biosynthesis protein A
MARVIADTSGVLLAGGKSRRMGQDKRFLQLEGTTFLTRVIRVLEQLFPEILIVVAEPVPHLSQSDHRVVIDRVPNCGSLGGLYTGLSYAVHARAFVVACDMPFLNPDAIAYMADIDHRADVVIAQLTTGMQPLHAVYAKECLPRLQRMIETKNLRLYELPQSPELSVRVVPEEQMRAVDPQLLSFFNVNRPTDLEFARKVSARRLHRDGHR